MIRSLFMSLSAFFLAYALVVLAPGPNLLIVLQIAMAGTRRAAVLTGVGAAFGAACLSLAVQIARRELPLDAPALYYMRFAFALMLVYCGLGCFRRAITRTAGAEAAPCAGFLRGMMVALVNPFTCGFVLTAGGTLAGGSELELMFGVALLVFLTAASWLVLMALVATSRQSQRLSRFDPRLAFAGVGVALLAMALHVATSGATD